jgi:hypothetical protein
MRGRAKNGALGSTVHHVDAGRQNFGGMTVNERLFVAGLVEPFDSAIDSGDRQRAIELLLRVAMSDDSAAETVDAVLAHPAKYGYPRST